MARDDCHKTVEAGYDASATHVALASRRPLFVASSSGNRAGISPGRGRNRMETRVPRPRRNTTSTLVANCATRRKPRPTSTRVSSDGRRSAGRPPLIMKPRAVRESPHEQDRTLGSHAVGARLRPGRARVWPTAEGSRRVIDEGRVESVPTTQEHSHGIRGHLDGLLSRIAATAARRRGDDDLTRLIGTAPDQERPDHPVSPIAKAPERPRLPATRRPE
jgi:hypothetical protein